MRHSRASPVRQREHDSRFGGNHQKRGHLAGAFYRKSQFVCLGHAAQF
jgi:hypothetical protein